MNTRTAAAAAVTSLLLLAGCGENAARVESALTGQPSDGAAYGEIVTAVENAHVTLCPSAEGGWFVPLPTPSAEVSQEYSYFRYLEGRIYEFGPCQLAAGKRNELRAYRYGDSATRDSAIRDVSKRNTRPTSTFAFRDVYALEIWSPEPSLDSPVGQVAAQAHSAIGRVPQARHLDVP